MQSSPHMACCAPAPRAQPAAARQRVVAVTTSAPCHDPQYTCVAGGAEHPHHHATTPRGREARGAYVPTPASSCTARGTTRDTAGEAQGAGAAVAQRAPFLWARHSWAPHLHQGSGRGDNDSSSASLGAGRAVTTLRGRGRKGALCFLGACPALVVLFVPVMGNVLVVGRLGCCCCLTERYVGEGDS